ncbi:DNA repair protein RecO [Bradymonadaceae bacterium TMQ3]|uniref:DNA repair protein RecO n=1 Tax=Lujinxingia sediminis TaxID=2480984 RepID=A0ABY0CQK7_9DELT|nr:DNA repair protein RecO [Lujinxingia sediminis]RDV37894.1 DNA repair protein RecO [Bradymonadaceae bacterium TMQ3]RVU42776.1 DNA repair protein RecO [Lujinxingia sediminis]TXC75327.1 DNA repair protein RecO [Bradymonadales bacterium TMQ1]
MSSRHSPCFILRTVDYGERDVIVTLLGRDAGRFAALARSARTSRKRFGGALQPLRMVEAIYTRPTRGDLHTLQELEVSEDYPGIEERLELLSAASYATELVRETWREGEDARAIFELLRQFYAFLPRCDDNLAILCLTHHFELSLLNLYGMAPSIAQCARCGKAAESLPRARFARSGEGLLCESCRHPGEAVGVIHPLTLTLLLHLEDPRNARPPLPLEDALAQARRVIDTSVDSLVTRALPAREMLRSLVTL